MKIEQRLWTSDNGWNEIPSKIQDQPQLVFVFGGRKELEQKQRFEEIRGFYPKAEIVANSTAGEIIDTTVYDNSIITTAIYFEKSHIVVKEINVEGFNTDFEAGKHLVEGLTKNELQSVFIISDGQQVNGDELVKGVHDSIGADTLVTGGLAGDAGHFEETIVGLNEVPKPGVVVAIGLYGENLQVGYGCLGGWDSFGPMRKITKSKHNVLYEIDGESALDLYKKYLGEKAKELPGSALLFPLSIKGPYESKPLVRTILSVDEDQKSMTFAGDVPEGYQVRLMKANFERLIDGAIDAAKYALKKTNDGSPELAILISCVGRKLVLNQRTVEEVEGVREVLGEHTTLTGFYSYGEISPFIDSQKCELHNQTMTITTFSEI